MAQEQYKEIQDLSAEELKEKASSFVDDNKTLLFGVIGGLFLLVIGGYAYKEFYKAPREAEAYEELYKANQYINKDSFQLALTGKEVIGQANNFIGYAGIIDEYSGTNASNLAHYYAGIACLNIGKPDLALDYLDNFSGEELMQTQAYTLMGDAASELQNMDAALGYYEQAAGNTDNLSVSLYAKNKLAKLLEFQGKTEEAKATYQAILDMDKQIGSSLGADKALVRLQ